MDTKTKETPYETEADPEVDYICVSCGYEGKHEMLNDPESGILRFCPRCDNDSMVHKRTTVALDYMIDRLQKQNDELIMQLARCLQATRGEMPECKEGDFGWSPTMQDTRLLYAKGLAKKEALARFGGHLSECIVFKPRTPDDDSPRGCDCGFEIVMTSFDLGAKTPPSSHPDGSARETRLVFGDTDIELKGASHGEND